MEETWWVRDCWEFAQAAYSEWQAVLGGSLALALLRAAINWLLGEKRSIPLSLLVASIVVWASFLAWRVEHRLAKDRPYFTAQEMHFRDIQMTTARGTLSSLGQFVEFKLVNSSERRPVAAGVRGDLVLLDSKLDPLELPVLVEGLGSVNEIGPSGNLNVGSSRLSLKGRLPPLYVYAEVSYRDKFDGGEYQQRWYLKFTGDQGGVFVSTLFHASPEEQRRMALCVESALGRPALP